MAVAVGDILNGVVTGVTKFGAFVKLEDGTTGLVHISEVADTYVKEVSEFLKEQDEVKVKVTSIGDNGKVALSIKQAIVKEKPVKKYQDRNQDRYESRNQDRFQDRYDSKPKVDSSFEDKLADFMKNSNEKLLTLKKHQDGRRGR